MLSAHGDFVQERTLLVMAEVAHRQKIDVDVSRLAPTREWSGNETVVPVSEYHAVLRCIFMEPKETLGIDLAGAIPVEALGLWGFLLRTSATFGAMLRRAERYSRVFFRYSRVSLSASGDQLILKCEHPTPSPFGRREQAISFFLGQWLTLGHTLIGDEVTPTEVLMRWNGPMDPTPFESFFGCPVRFDSSEDALVFSRRVLKLPLPEHTPELGDMFEEYAAAVIHRIGTDSTFVEQVREALSEGLLAGARDQSAVARQLNITTRTLRRRLADSGSSFREIRHDLLQARAKQMLRDERLPIAEISYLLGYSEPANFHRAFRNWTNLSPGEWRERQSRVESLGNQA
ncbi:MAG: AraC family transcriptional regulator ligand-binding domain-containing protein [Lysobacterales bacterium]|jgi:AraC-like DNA-binding protein